MIDIFRKIRLILNGRIWTIKPKTPEKGRVLLSYTTLPFVSPNSLGGHSNRWECKRIAEIWSERGYSVDIVDFSNSSFKPRRRYNFCIDVENALERLAPHLGNDCMKIFHITSAHWKFQNEAELRRLANLEKRCGIKLKPTRQVPLSRNIEVCDMATILGNEFTIGTYAFADKKIIRIPISTTHTFPSPENKDFEKARKSFIWLGGSGMAHKGLDLVLEAFAQMPDFQLTVFGKKDEDFAKAYHKELFETPNIKFEGMVELGDPIFAEAIGQSIGMVFPSCSEGSSGGVIVTMHAGLIPLISYESGVDIKGFGTILKENTIDEIKKEAVHLSSLSIETLKARSVAAWKYARENHTREMFSKTYENFVDSVISGKISK